LSVRVKPPSRFVTRRRNRIGLSPAQRPVVESVPDDDIERVGTRADDDEFVGHTGPHHRVLDIGVGEMLPSGNTWSRQDRSTL
jgi:hypothetical protein